MTLKDVFKQLNTIDSKAASLLATSGFRSGEGLLETVRPLRDPAEDTFLRRAAENMLESLKLLHEELTYLKSPVCEACRLELFSDGRYGFFDRDGAPHCLSCGTIIEAKIHDQYGRFCWTRCRIEHDSSDYYLFGHKDIPLAGLTVRKREVTS